MMARANQFLRFSELSSHLRDSTSGLLVIVDPPYDDLVETLSLLVELVEPGQTMFQAAYHIGDSHPLRSNDNAAI